MQKDKKKGSKSLGRGLGSLLGNAGGFERPPAAPKKINEKPSLKNKPKVVSKKINISKEKINSSNLENNISVEDKTSKIEQNKNTDFVATPVPQKIVSLEKEEKEIISEVSKPVFSHAPSFAKQDKVDPSSSMDLENKIWNMAIEKVTPNHDQPRRDFEPNALKELANSIKQQGILQPIVVRPASEHGKYEIIAGERRWRASQLAGLFTIPVIVKKVEEQKSLELALIENIQREDLNPVEEAEAYKLLIDRYHLTQSQLAEKMGKERATIANLLRLLSLDKQVKNMLKAGEISMGHAKVLLSMENLIDQRKMAQLCFKKKLSVRALEKFVKKGVAYAKEASENMVSDRIIEEMALQLQKLMGRKVNIDYRGGKGKIGIYFHSDDEYTEITNKLKDAWKK